MLIFSVEKIVIHRRIGAFRFSDTESQHGIRFIAVEDFFDGE